MTTTHQKQRSRSRFAAAAMLAATSYNQQLAEQIALASNGGGLIVVSACPS
jgi:hypothetical protein